MLIIIVYISLILALVYWRLCERIETLQNDNLRFQHQISNLDSLGSDVKELKTRIESLKKALENIVETRK